MEQRKLSIVSRSNGFESLKSLTEVKKLKTPMPQELIWICSECGTIEPLLLPSGRWIKRTCDCQKQAKKAATEALEHQKWLQKARERCYGGWLGPRCVDADIVREMCSKTFETFDVDRQPEAFYAAWKYAQNPVGNLLFCGSYGTGKTHLEAAICNYLIEVIGKSCLIASAPQFFRAYMDAIGRSDKTNSIMLIDQAIATPLLVIDDVDKAKPSEFRMDTYFEVLDERYKAKRPTIISTNKEESLADYIGESVANSRFNRRLTVVEMSGDDYRLEEEI